MKEVIRHIINKIIRYTLIVAMVAVVLFAVVMSLARFFMPSLEQYEQKLADLVAQELGLIVHFASFAGDWYRFGPALKVTDIVLSNEQGEVVTKIDTLYVSINIISSISQRQIVPAYVNVIGLDVEVEQFADDTWDIVGWPGQSTPNRARELILDASKKYDSIIVRRSQINIKPYEAKMIPLDIRKVVLSRSGQNHQIEVLLNLLNQPTQLELLAEVKGDFAHPDDLAIHSYIKLENAIFDDYFKHYQVGDYAIEGGTVDLTAWIDWQAGYLQHVQAQTDVQQLLLWSYTKGTALERLNVKSEFLWDISGLDTWTLSGSNILLGFADAQPTPVMTQFKLTQKEDTHSFSAESIDIAQVVDLLLFSDELPTAQQALLQDLNPRGNIRNLQIEGQPDDWKLGLQFDGVTYQTTGPVPGAENLKGELIATPNTGKISFDTKEAWVNYTSLFPEPFLFSDMKGNVFWEYGGKFWEIRSEEFLLKNEDMQLHSTFLIQGGETLDTYLDISAHTEGVNSINGYKYVPVGELPQELNDWLRNSIGPGLVERLDLQIKGPAKDFPYYDEGNGAFRLHLNVKDLELTFDPDWPKLEKVEGEMLLAGRNLQIALPKATIYGTDLIGAVADISMPKVGPNWLNVRGEAITLAANAVQFVNATPLAEDIGSYLNLFTIDAPITLTLDLGIPLDADGGDVQVQGHVQISEGDVYAKEWDLHFSGVNGLLGFTQKGAYSDGIHAQLFNKPVLMTISPLKNKNQNLTQWNIAGMVSIEEMAKQIPSSMWTYASGESQFTAGFLTGKDTPGLDFTIVSDLKGIALDLPAPLKKSKESVAPMRYSTSVNDPKYTRMRLEFNQLIDGIIGLKKNSNNQDTLAGGRVQLGGTLKNIDIPNGVFVSGQLQEFSVDTWRDFIAKLKPATTTQNQPGFTDDILTQLQQVDVSINKLEAFHYPLTRVQVRLNRAADAWNLKLASNEWSGRIDIPLAHSKSPLRMDFSHCEWNTALYTKGTETLDPRSIPALNFSCQDFIFDKKSLGTLKLEAVPQEMGLRLTRVDMIRKNDAISASGQWWYAPNGERTRLAGTLKSNAIDKTLSLVDIKSTIIGSKTETDFILLWPGSPFDFSLAQLSGELNVRLNGGVLVDVSPGFGRILSLLSVQSLQRRLRLDFSDVFKKGFSFDSITALVTMKDGIAHSSNLVMKAPAAEMKMQGDVNLGTKQLNLSAIVTAHISSSLPLAATIASGGNPIVGAVGVGVWAVDKIVKSQAGDKMGSNYRITGTWEKPIVNGK